MKEYSYFSFLKIDSYNAPFNYVETLRDRGKTYAKLYRTAVRFRKSGRGAVFLRRLEKETKADIQSVLRSEKTRAILARAGLNPDEMRTHANFLEAKRGGRWCTVAKFGALSDSGNFRGNDDSALNALYLDEGVCPIEKRNMFRGNEVEAFLDIVKSCRRDDMPLKCYILANKEAYTSPYLSYFGIPPIPDGWDGIRLYKKGGWAVQSDLTPPPKRQSRESDKYKAALVGTPYGEYLTEGKARCAPSIKIGQKPEGARLYLQVDFGTPLSFYEKDGNMYVCAGVDRSRGVLVPGLTAKYEHSRVWSTRYRGDFAALAYAKRMNAVYFSSPAVFEYASAVFDKMNI